MRRLLLLPLAISVVVLTASGQVPDKGAPKKKGAPSAELLKGNADDLLKRLDKNKDGYLTKDELPPRLAERFAELDRNGDGKLDKKEVEAMFQVLRKMAGDAPSKGPERPEVERRVNEMLERLDTNKDGKISKDEAKGPLAENFDRVDTNKDGYLDKSELRAAAARMLGMQKGAPGKGVPNGSRPDFDALDKDADGRLTKDELKGTPYFDRFDDLDTNKDGKIDRKEFQAYLKKQDEKKEK